MINNKLKLGLTYYFMETELFIISILGVCACRGEDLKMCGYQGYQTVEEVQASHTSVIDILYYISSSLNDEYKLYRILRLKKSKGITFEFQRSIYWLIELLETSNLTINRSNEEHNK